jgi:polyhydroxybutyrate depolymerase
MLNPFVVLPNRPSARSLGWVWYVLIICALATLAPVAVAQQKVEISFRMGMLKRTATAYLPDNPSRQDTWPLIIALHPGFATGDDMAKISKLHRQKGSENFVVVYPDGFKRSWNAGDCCGAAEKRNVDDIGFILRLIDKVGEIIPIKKKVFVAGYSNGALMAYRLACKVPDRLAAFAVYAGAPTLNKTTCDPSHAVPLLHLHGDLDAIAPLEGGKSSIESAGVRTSVLSNTKYWTQMNHCGTERESDFVKAANCTVYRGCRDDSEAIFCIYPRQGHYWPGAESSAFGKKRGLGPARTDLNGGEEMIRFFKRYR